MKKTSRKRPGHIAEWLACRTRNLMIAGLSLTDSSNILGQVMNPVDAKTMLSIKKLAMCSTRGGSQGMYTTFASAM